MLRVLDPRIGQCWEATPCRFITTPSRCPRQVPLALGHNAIHPGGLMAEPPRRPASHAGFRSLKITSHWARRMPSIAVSVEALDFGTAERWQASSPTTLRPLRSKADRQHTSKKLAMSWAPPRAARSPSPFLQLFPVLPKNRFAAHLRTVVRPVAS